MENSPAPWAQVARKSRATPEIGDTANLRRETGGRSWFVIVPGVPIGKDRARTGNGRHYSTARMGKAERLVARCAIEQNAGRAMITGAVSLSIVAVMPTTSQRVIDDPMPAKPDWDNIAKLVCDGLNKAGVWSDDARVAEARFAKFYGNEPRLIVKIEPCPMAPVWAFLLRDGERVH